MKIKVIVTGASGFIGSALVLLLKERGFEVVTLSLQKAFPPLETLEGADWLFHLAGQSIGSRWSFGGKKKLFESRVQATQKLSSLLASLKSPPKFWFGASAVGYYGDMSKAQGERALKGRGFLSDLAAAWEKAHFEGAKAIGARLVIGRFGLVLDRSGGLLPKMTLPFRWGLPLWVGKKGAYRSLIPRKILLEALLFLAENKKAHGAINITLPHPILDEEFAKILAAPFGSTPWILPPFGEKLTELLGKGQAALPDKLCDLGFLFPSDNTQKIVSDISKLN